MRVLFTVAGTRTPGSRFRVQQFFPYFERMGIRPSLLAAYGDRYNVHAGRPYAPMYKLAARLKRAASLLSAGRYDAIFHQRLALPFTAFPERVGAYLNEHIAYDFDDAVFLRGPSAQPSEVHRRAFKVAVSLSNQVIAGNRYLAHHTGAPDKTIVIPTVIDTDTYTPAAADPRKQVCVGWMGTASNFPQLMPVVPALLQLLDAQPRLTLRLVSNQTFAPLSGHSRVEQIRWSETEELDLLRSFDVGMMPLDDTPWTRGKCGFKLIQYMAVGVPIVASAVGANVDVAPDGLVGRLVTPGDDWLPALTELVENAQARRQYAEAAREHAVAHYSVASVLPLYEGVFQRLA